MVVVPAGSFLMGSADDEVGHHVSEGPRRRVTIAKRFAVARYEVTFASWDACATEGGGCGMVSDQGWGRDRRPVINVSWDEVTRHYLPWLTRKTGKDYRLLTEAEWEHAARGIAGREANYHFGHDAGRLCGYANVADRAALATYAGWTIAACRDDQVHTAPVGSFQPNDFGLYDMHGNVWEWVQDCWSESYSGAASDGSAWTQGDCSLRVVRGGSWDSVPSDLRLASRFKGASGASFSNLGFRVVRALQD